MTSERKRKNPPRGAASRVEHVAKKRTSTPPERSLTPAPAPTPTPAPEPVVEEPQLPKSVQPGNPLPTVENAQPDDLSSKEYQSIQESGVLVESLTRSRQKWINEGIFEKYWTKPVKRKGVVKEEPNNPPKDSMQKIGSIIISIEPHVLEATMFGVKDNFKPPVPTTNSAFRPVMQYGPPNGVMPPPPKPPTPVPTTPSTPSAVPASPSQAPPQPTVPASPSQRAPSQPPTQAGASAPAPVLARPPTPSQPQPMAQMQQPEPQRATPATTAPSPSHPPVVSAYAAPPGSVLAPPGAPQPPPALQPPMRSPAPHGVPTQPLASPISAPAQPGVARPPQAPSASPTTGGPLAAPGPPKPATPSSKPAAPAPSGADPIIVTLAEKASEDPHLRDLMKRVAVGDAAPHELSHFQKIIDQITAEYRKKGGQQGPSADRLLVDGRTVKYFADEVRAILDIVLSSNPNQKGSDLRQPPGSDALVILLVKRALDDHTTRNMVRRVAENKTKFSDATDLKGILDKLKDQLPKPGSKTPQTPLSNPGQGQVNGAVARKPSISQSPAATPTSQQALRSKGPPPSFKTEYSAIVLEFSGGTGDRYLFPKYSILEYQPGASQVLVSFLIVRKGSKSEYGGDPALDYYQPMTIRITSPSGKYLEQLARVVAPQDEVRRYMDDVMDNMTRAEYILLAMRLPRPDKEDQTEDRVGTPKVDGQQQPQPQPQPQQGVLWTTKAAPAKLPSLQPGGKVLGEDEQYQNFIATVS
ncbi:hypothetical protein JX266_005073 [Neoarthrinium moseri]|nr:hypothetical protein JX266_005073 [Neoarthrinium moseri]